ncbi:MAG: sugar nucleotide-binding protein [Anaerolineaceae bacterium]|nr:sugar nucleotide-binding protein [Anaerolineaceae bacterium]
MRLFLTGGSGLVGSNVIRAARQQGDWEIIAGHYGPEPEWRAAWPRDYVLHPLDMADLDAIRSAIAQVRPAAVLHCAALLDHDWLDANRAAAWHVTVAATRTFAEACREHGVRFVFISSDWVFDGQEPFVDEDSPPHPVNFYGIMKFACERELASMDDLDYAVARLAGIYGMNYSNPALLRDENGLGFDLHNFIIKRLTRGQVAPIWMGPKTNDIAHPTLASDGAEQVLRLVRSDRRGIFHCFGSECTSRLEMAYSLADLFGVDRSLLAPVPTDPEVLRAHSRVQIPYRIRSSTEKTAAALGRNTLGVQAALHRFKQEWDEFQEERMAS